MDCTIGDMIPYIRNILANENFKSTNPTETKKEVENRFANYKYILDGDTIRAVDGYVDV